MGATKDQSRQSSEYDGAAEGNDLVLAVARWAAWALVKRWWLCALLFVASVCGAIFGANMFVQPSYKASGIVEQKSLPIPPEMRDRYEQMSLNNAVLYVAAPDSLKVFQKEFGLGGVPVEVLRKSFIEVEPEPGTSSIRVSVTVKDPQEAADMVNRLMELFNEKLNEKRRSYIADYIEAADYLTRIQDSGQAEAEARKRLDEFKRKYEITDIDADLTIVEADLARAIQARQQAVKDRNTAFTAHTANEGLIESTIAKAKDELAREQGTLRTSIEAAVEKFQFLEKDLERDQKLHDNGALSKRALEETRQKYNVAKIELDGLRNQMGTSKAKLETLQDPKNLDASRIPIPTLVQPLRQRSILETRLAGAEETVTRLDEKEESTRQRRDVLRRVRPEDAGLTRSLTTASAGHAELVRERKLLQSLGDMDADEFVVTTVAEPPTSPWGRQWLKFVVVALAGGIALSGLVVVAVDLRNCPVLSGGLGTQETGMPVIASPTVCGELPGFLDGGRQLDQGVRDLSMRIRQVLTEPGRVVLGANLRRQVPLLPLLVPLADCFARRDERVVIVDFTLPGIQGSRKDLHSLIARGRRSGRSHGDSDIGHGGLGEYLLREKDLREITYPTRLELVDCIPAGEIGEAHLLASSRMDAMLRDLRDKYSIVLIAGPDQTQSVALETLILRADGVLVVASPSEQSSSEFYQFVERLAELQAPVLGAALVTYAASTQDVAVRRRKGKAKWKEVPA